MAYAVPAVIHRDAEQKGRRIVQSVGVGAFDELGEGGLGEIFRLRRTVAEKDAARCSAYFICVQYISEL